MTDLLLQFTFALFATCGFCIIFRVPAKHIPICVVIGALGWTSYQVSMYYDASPVLSCFIASCAVGLLSDIGARLCKEASTVFIIPGILCLVPGSGMYHTMTSMLSHDMDATASIGAQTLMMAGAIATGLLVIGSVIRVIRSLAKKTIALKPGNK
ncbi:MAG: threonine/serine exporter family protein [Bacillota bacterium]|nr:threonine/serine exporter family protein [Bacillota bacterium]